MIAQRGYSTMSTGLDGETHAVAEYKPGFNSCAINSKDSIPCDVLATHLVRYGFTQQQALALVSASPHAL
jgi:hypothetical protein